jgi:hypothetical protein
MTWGVLSSQEFQEISTGTGYNLQSYVNIGDGTSKQVANNAWDIAFSIDPQDAGVFINRTSCRSWRLFELSEWGVSC